MPRKKEGFCPNSSSGNGYLGIEHWEMVLIPPSQDPPIASYLQTHETLKLNIGTENFNIKNFRH